MQAFLYIYIFLCLINLMLRTNSVLSTMPYAEENAPNVDFVNLDGH